MKVRLLKIWDRLGASFWFVPALMALGAVLLVFASLFVDERVGSEWWRDNMSLAYTGGAEGASTVLGTIAGSMMTIAGVVFSMTLVALTLASSQFGPRLLRNFMSDTTNQMVLGTFVATFLYCLLVLRTLRFTEEDGFVPHLSVTVGVLLALLSMGVMIYFIHHVSVSIQADEIISSVARELMNGVDRMFPEKVDEEEARSGEDLPSPEPFPDPSWEAARPAASGGDGYVQFIDVDALVRLAEKKDAILRLERRPGQYISEGSVLALVCPGERMSKEMVERINGAVVLGNQRTPAQDIGFPLSQLVEIAVRALSPGVNDPHTAIRCVDRLGSALCRLAGRAPPSPHRLDGRNRLRVVAHPRTFPEMTDAAFNQIRQNARDTAAVPSASSRPSPRSRVACIGPKTKPPCGGKPRSSHAARVNACRSSMTARTWKTAFRRPPLLWRIGGG